MNLSEIKFTVDTGALDSAIGKIAQLKASVGTLKETAATRKDSLTVQREEIKTAKEQNAFAFMFRDFNLTKLSVHDKVYSTKIFSLCYYP